MTRARRSHATKRLIGNSGPKKAYAVTGVRLAPIFLSLSVSILLLASAGNAEQLHNKAQTVGYHLTINSEGLAVKTGTPSSDPKLFAWSFTPGEMRIETTIAGASLRAEPELARMRGHRITVADVFKLASALEAEEKRHGLIFARAVIPSQLFHEGGCVIVKIVDVRVAALKGDGIPSSMMERLRNRGNGLIAKAEPSGRTVAGLAGWAQYEFGQDVTLKAGETRRADQIDLVASGPVHSIVSEVTTSTFLAKPFQVSTVGLASTGYDLFGLHERVAVGGTYAREHDTPLTNGPLWSLSAAGALPVDAFGVFLEPSVASARLHLADHAGSNEAYAVTKGAFFVSAPVALDGDAALVARAGVESTSENLAYRFAFSDGIVALRLPFETFDARSALSWSKRLESGIALEAGLDADIGFTRGGGDAAIVDLREGSWPIGRAEMRGKVDVPIAFDVTATIGGRIAASFLGPLPPSQQVQLLQAIGAAPPIDPRTIQGDSGAFIRAELARTFNTHVEDRSASLQPYIFGSAGVLYSRESAFEYANRVTGFSAGLGLRLVFALPQRDVPLVEVTLEGSRQETTSSDVPNYSSVTLAGRLRF